MREQRHHGILSRGAGPCRAEGQPRHRSRQRYSPRQGYLGLPWGTGDFGPEARCTDAPIRSEREEARSAMRWSTWELAEEFASKAR